MLLAAEVEDTDPYCLGPGEAAGLLAGHPWRRFVVVGDSIAEGLGDPVPGYVNLPWADRVAAELRRPASDLEYLNFGRRSLPAAQVRATQLAAAIAARPDLALVGCGNDALRRSYDGDAVDREVSAIVAALCDAGAVVMTVSLLVFDVYPRMPLDKAEPMRARLLEHADRTARLAEALGTVHVDLRDHPGRHEPDMLSVDGLHANGRAHGLCAAAVVRRLGAHLATQTG
jgi:lysophospholipase L1-like esterase